MEWDTSSFFPPIIIFGILILHAMAVLFSLIGYIPNEHYSSYISVLTVMQYISFFSEIMLCK